MVSLKQLNYALEIEKTLNFKRAADRCFISASTLSNSILQIERSLGAKIFERDTKRVLVTPFGRLFLEKAKRVQLEMKDIAKLGDVFSGPLTQQLAIGVIPTIAPFLLPLVLPDLQKSYPDLTLKITESTSQSLVHSIKSGELDTAILALPFPQQGLLSFKFWSEDFFLISHRDRVSGGPGPVGAKEIDPEELMLLDEGHCLTDQALEICSIASESTLNTGASSLTTLVGLVGCNLGQTLVPEMALVPLVNANPELASSRLADPGPHREIAFLVRSNYANMASIELLRDFFFDCLSKARGKSSL
tara:strand:+ start:136 stop:1047 length:912 start_codon:yes stop_codon:yes gene_type:complete